VLSSRDAPPNTPSSNHLCPSPPPPSHSPLPLLPKHTNHLLLAARAAIAPRLMICGSARGQPYTAVTCAPCMPAQAIMECPLSTTHPASHTALQHSHVVLRGLCRDKCCAVLCCAVLCCVLLQDLSSLPADLAPAVAELQQQQQQLEEELQLRWGGGAQHSTKLVQAAHAALLLWPLQPCYCGHYSLVIVASTALLLWPAQPCYCGQHSLVIVASTAHTPPFPTSLCPPLPCGSMLGTMPCQTCRHHTVCTHPAHHAVASYPTFNTSVLCCPAAVAPRYQLPEDQKTHLVKLFDHAFDCCSTALLSSHKELITLDKENARAFATK